MPDTATSSTLTALCPIDKVALAELAARAKSHPAAVVTLKAHTVCTGKFRNLSYVRNLAAHVIDEPPHLLGDDTAPNPSEALLAALGSCLSVGVQANATAQGITLHKLEVVMEGDINVTAVWGVGDLSCKWLGFSAIRVSFHIEADVPRDTLAALIAHADAWSPVANTLRNPVPISVQLA